MRTFLCVLGGFVIGHLCLGLQPWWWAVAVMSLCAATWGLLMLWVFKHI